MSSLVNLHTHSNLSDGHESHREVVRLAAQVGTKVMALTDHDMTTGVEEAINEGTKLGVQVIPATEISSRLYNKTLHVLAYGIDIQNQALQKLLLHLRDFRREGMLKKMNEILSSLPEEKKFDMKEFIKTQGEYFCISKSMDFLLEHGVVTIKDEAWPLLQGLEVAARDVSIDQVIHTVHGAGGIAVLAHPLGPVAGIPGITKDPSEQLKIISDLKQQGLDGVECYQLSHVDEDVPRALRFAKELKLIITAGSDWHGPLSLKNQTIKNVIPDYQEHFGDFSVPESEAMKIIQSMVQ